MKKIWGLEFFFKKMKETITHPLPAFFVLLLTFDAQRIFVAF